MEKCVFWRIRVRCLKSAYQGMRLFGLACRCTRLLDLAWGGLLGEDHPLIKRILLNDLQVSSCVIVLPCNPWVSSGSYYMLPHILSPPPRVRVKRDGPPMNHKLFPSAAHRMLRVQIFSRDAVVCCWILIRWMTQKCFQYIRLIFFLCFAVDGIFIIFCFCFPFLCLMAQSSRVLFLFLLTDRPQFLSPFSCLALSQSNGAKKAIFLTFYSFASKPFRCVSQVPPKHFADGNENLSLNSFILLKTISAKYIYNCIAHWLQKLI